MEKEGRKGGKEKTAAAAAEGEMEKKVNGVGGVSAVSLNGLASVERRPITEGAAFS